MHYAACLSWRTLASLNETDFSKLPAFEQDSKFKEIYLKIIKDILKLLINHSNDINQVSNDHKTAFSLALDHENYEIAELILENPLFDVYKVSLADSCAYHDLSHCLIYSEGRKLFCKVNEKMGHRIKEFVNLIDQFGYTPILRFVENYINNANT